MIKAGAGFSRNKNSKDAAKEAATQAMETGGLTKADFALSFCSFPHSGNYSQILGTVRKIANTENVTGCSGFGVLSNLGEAECEPGVAILAVSSDEIEAGSFLTAESGGGGTEAGKQIGEKLAHSNRENGLLTILADPFHIHPELLFRGVESNLGEIPIVGAAASEDPRINQTFAFCGETAAEGAVSALMLRGNFNYEIGITQGCRLMGTPSMISKAKKNLIYELDGKPAIEVLEERIPRSILESEKDIMRLLFTAFAPNPEDKEIETSEYLVRNLIGFDPDAGAIGVAHEVQEGQLICFALRNPASARDDLKRMLERLKSREKPDKPYRFGLYFNCLGRGASLYGHEGIDTAYITNVLGNIPLAGFFGNSEFAPLKGKNHLFTYTGVLVIFSEG